MKNREPWNFCETPKEKCTMNHCDENGCQNRKRNYAEGNDLIADVVMPKGALCTCINPNSYPITEELSKFYCTKCGKEKKLKNNFKLRK